ncbi:MAG: outer membrane protein assembly factor BamD [Pseudomonadota bacterium]
MSRFSGILGLLLCTALISACGQRDGGGLFGNRAEAPAEQLTAEQLFARGENQLANGDPEDAAQSFSDIERLYPYSELAARASLRQAVAYHRAEEYDQSRAAAQRFIDFYPADPNAAQAQYLIALSFYDQMDRVSRDQGVTFQALQALRVTIERYPESEYTNSALLKFDLALDQLAGKEMDVGRFYLKRGHPGAAINRFRVVVEDFQTTSHTPEALHRLVESYLILGLSEEARTAGAILGFNYQGSEWYEDTFALLQERGLDPSDASTRGDGWLTKIYRQVLRGQWI